MQVCFIILYAAIYALIGLIIKLLMVRNHPQK